MDGKNGLQFVYREQDMCPAEQIFLLMPDRNIRMAMEKHEGIWEVRVPFTGIPERYKYELDGVLRLNDPSADSRMRDADGEVWSVTGSREICREAAGRQSGITTGRLVVTNHLWERTRLAIVHREFSRSVDSRVVCGIYCRDIAKLHALTAVFRCPDRRIFHIVEDAAVEGLGSEAELWFWMSLQEEGRNYPEGMWSVQIFVDGRFCREEVFRVKEDLQESRRGFYW